MESAVIYARYSSEKQTEQSIEGQLHVCNEYAGNHNLKIIKTYIDRAKTGRNDNREEFQQMLRDSATKKFTVILVYALDRFARNRYDSAINKKFLRKNNVRVISATQPISDTPEGILLESLLEGLDEYYSAELARKLARGRRESVEEKGQFIGGTTPYGYKIENKKYVIYEPEAENVRLIYKLFQEQKSYKFVRNYLKENCIHTRNNKEFYQTPLKHILTNKIYTGVLKIGNFINESAVPVIIPKEQFVEVQKIVENNLIKITKSSIDFLLTGKLFCGECGESFYGESGTPRKDKTYYYYNCKNRKIKKSCTAKKYRKEDLENRVYKKIVEEINSSEFVDFLVSETEKLIKEIDYSSEINRLKNELLSIDKKLDNIVNAIMSGIVNEKLKKQNAELLDKKEDLETKIEELSKYSLNYLTADYIKKFIKEKYLKSNKETIIELLVYKVYIYNSGKIVIILSIPTNNDYPIKRKIIEDEVNIKDFVCSNKSQLVEQEQLYSNIYKQVLIINNIILYKFYTQIIDT